MYTMNPINISDIKLLYSKCVEIIEDVLIDKKIWKTLGTDDAVDWEKWTVILKTFANLSDAIECRSVGTICDFDEIQEWEDFTNDVFY